MSAELSLLLPLEESKRCLTPSVLFLRCEMEAITKKLAELCRTHKVDYYYSYTNITEQLETYVTSVHYVSAIIISYIAWDQDIKPFFWLDIICFARWKNLSREGYGYADFHHCRRYGPPSFDIINHRNSVYSQWPIVHGWRCPLMEDEVINIEQRFGFIFPSEYREFLTTRYRPQYDESRLLLTDWINDEEEEYSDYSYSEEEENARRYNQRGERKSLEMRMEYAALNISQGIVDIYSRTYHTHLSYGEKSKGFDFLPNDLKNAHQEGLREVARKMFDNKREMEAKENNVPLIPALIPIAHGVSHFFVLDRRFGGNSSAVFEFTGYSLRVVASTFEHFMILYYNGFSHNYRGWWGFYLTECHDYSELWQSKTKNPFLKPYEIPLPVLLHSTTPSIAKIVCYLKSKCPFWGLIISEHSWI